MPVFYLDKPPALQEEFEIKDAELVNHLNVFRIKEKEIVKFFSQEQIYVCEVKAFSKKGIKIFVQKSFAASYPKLRTSIVQGLIDKICLEETIRLNIPLYVQRFIFFRGERSNFALNDKIERRLSIIARTAAEQSEVCFLPEIVFADSLDGVFNMLSKHDIILLMDPSSICTLSDYTEKIKVSGSVAFIVGPEGGFSDREIISMKDNQVNSFSLKTGIFRSELAGFAASLLVRELIPG